MTLPGLAFCIVLPVFFGAIAVITHLVTCHTERLRLTHFSAPVDVEAYHFGPAHKDFIDKETRNV